MYRGDCEEHDKQLFFSQDWMPDQRVCEAHKTSPSLLDERDVRR